MAQALDGFTAAPFTPEEQARRAAQLVRFLDLVPIEYRDGTDDGRVTIPFEIQEAIAFRDGAASAFSDLEAALDRARPAGRGHASSARWSGSRPTSRTPAAAARWWTRTRSRPRTRRPARRSTACCPEEWQRGRRAVRLRPDRSSRSTAWRRPWAPASTPRPSRPGSRPTRFFEFGPELSLRSIAPGVVARVEGLVWFGAEGNDGLAKLIAERRPRARRARDAPGARRGARGRRRRAGRRRQHRHGGDQRRGDRVPRGARGRADPGRGDGEPAGRGARPAAPDAVRRAARAGGQRDHLHPGPDGARPHWPSTARSSRRWWASWPWRCCWWCSTGSSTASTGPSTSRSSTSAGGACSAWPAAARPRCVGFVLLGFSTVYREGFETVLFLQALELNSGLMVVLEGVAARQHRGGGRGGGHVRARAQAALQEDADRDRRAAHRRARW